MLEGDVGARIYAVLPARRVQCTAARLLTLLRDLDAIAWPGNDANSAVAETFTTAA